jgi:hypothetical protein
MNATASRSAMVLSGPIWVGDDGDARHVDILLRRVDDDDEEVRRHARRSASTWGSRASCSTTMPRVDLARALDLLGGA